MEISEKKIEQYLLKKVKTLGGWAVKLTSPSVNGLPDRMVCFPGGLLVFVELKRPGKKGEPLQRVVHRELRGLGQLVFELDSFEAIDEFIVLCRQQINLK